VEEAVDQYLYWDEEVTIIEAVNSVSQNLLYLFHLLNPCPLNPLLRFLPESIGRAFHPLDISPPFPLLLHFTQ
jgi:hypothetical protein